jgi:hypothetical protein
MSPRSTFVSRGTLLPEVLYRDQIAALVEHGRLLPAICGHCQIDLYTNPDARWFMFEFHPCRILCNCRNPHAVKFEPREISRLYQALFPWSQFT